MSKESLDQFIQKVTDSEELQARIGEEMDADSLIALGAEHGCEFSAKELTAGAELSDEELDSVTGGLSLSSLSLLLRDLSTGLVTNTILAKNLWISQMGHLTLEMDRRTHEQRKSRPIHSESDRRCTTLSPDR